MTQAKTKKHTEPKFRNDPEMFMYRMLRTHSEGRRDEKVKTNTMTLDAEVAQEANTNILQLFQKAKPDEVDDKPQKRLKLSTSERRLKKVGLDLSAVDETIAEIDAQPNSYLVPIKASLQTIAADLRGLTHKMHNDALNNGENHEALWAQAVDLCTKLKRDIESARGLLNPSHFAPYTTALDGPLGIK